MKRLTAMFAAALLAAAALTGCQSTNPSNSTSGGKELQKVTVNEVARSVFYAPQYAAIELGFFEDEGLDVDLATGQGADKVMTAVIAGQVDIGLAGPEATIYVYNEGKADHSVLFAQLTKRDGSFLVGREKVDQFSWENLRGSYIIGGRKGGVPEMTLEYVLGKNGLKPGVDVTVDTSVQFALMAGAFTGGQGDYVALFEPTASMVEKEGKGYILTSIGEESGEIPYTAYFANKSYIEAHPDIIQKFTNAVYRGQQWVDSHTPQEVAQQVIKYFPDTDPEIMATVCKRYQEIDAWNKDPLLKEESLDLLQDVMQNAGELDARVDYREIVDPSFAKQAIESVK